ncbi:MAG TPA: ATP-binding cassette domain-containing protein [Blastococcus sp.]|nr:ATP-binding cassette domain-containing protein [Blastococcus sp.]
MSAPLLEVSGLRKTYVTKRNVWGKATQRLTAVGGVSFTLEPGRTLGIVGETGAGKSTVGRLVLRLIEPDSGSVKLLGQDVLAMPRKELRSLRAKAQMIFQDPFSSLDPRMVIGAAVEESLTVHADLSKADREQRSLDLLQRVGLRADQMDRYPREFSGGQLQRIAIARALANDPDFIVCDEPVAALDVSIQAQVLNLLLDLQAERGLGYLFISHDLSLVRFLAHDVIVMYKGEVVEMGPTAQLFADPQHAYTRKLLSAIPVAQPRRERARALSGAVLSSLIPPASLASAGVTQGGRPSC